MSEREVILIRETALESWTKDAGVLALFVSLIGIGAWLDSSALQWVGALIGFFAIFAKAATVRKTHIMTIS